MKIEYASVCDIGKCRKENQDAVYTKTGDGWGIFVVADGMGGHSEGGRASTAIVEAFELWIENIQTRALECEISFLFSELRRVLSEVNDMIFADTEAGKLCGSTAVVLLVIREIYILLSVGDSRCYELKKGFPGSTLNQLSTDEICTVPGKDYGKLLNAVGTEVPLKCRLISGEVKKKHIFFLCSDGVYKFCSEKELLNILKNIKGNFSEAVTAKIKKLVYQKGAKDNFTAIIVAVSL